MTLFFTGFHALQVCANQNRVNIASTLFDLAFYRYKETTHCAVQNYLSKQRLLCEYKFLRIAYEIATKPNGIFGRLALNQV